MHSIKVADIPLVRFRDKGTPADNLSNYNSAQERMLYVAPLASIKASTLMFVTADSMCKLVSGTEFDVAKRTIASTKLAEEDTLVFVGAADEMEQVGPPEHRRRFPPLPETGSFHSKESIPGSPRNETGRRR